MGHGRDTKARFASRAAAAMLAANRNAVRTLPRMGRIAIIGLILLASAPARSEPARDEAPPADTSAPVPAAPVEPGTPPDPGPAPPPAAGRSDADLRESVCLMIESAARA